MYLLSSEASRFSLRILTGARARPVCEHPSNPRGQATSDAAAAGTGAKDARRTSRASKKVSVARVTCNRKSMEHTYSRILLVGKKVNPTRIRAVVALPRIAREPRVDGLRHRYIELKSSCGLKKIRIILRELI